MVNTIKKNYNFFTLENYQNEMEKVSNLNDLIISLRQELKKKNSESDQIESYKEKITTLNNNINELKIRLRVCEENSEKKDKLAENMKKSLDMVQDSIKEVEEKNHSHMQEKELLKGALNHVKINFYFIFFSFVKWLYTQRMSLFLELISSVSQKE